MKPMIGSLTILLPLLHLLFIGCLQNSLSNDPIRSGSDLNSESNLDTNSRLSFAGKQERTAEQDPKQRRSRGDADKKTLPLGHIVGISPFSRKYWDPDNNWYFEVNDVTGYLHGSEQLGTYSDPNCTQELFESKVDVADCSADTFSDRRPVFGRQGDQSGWTKSDQAVTLGAITIVNNHYVKDSNGVCESTNDTESFCARTLEVLPDFPTSFAIQTNQ